MHYKMTNPYDLFVKNGDSFVHKSNLQTFFWKKGSTCLSICISIFVWQMNIHMKALFVHTNRDIEIDRLQNIPRSLEVLLDLVRNIARITPGGNKNSHSVEFAQ